jgi:hypothetical protein
VVLGQTPYPNSLEYSDAYLHPPPTHLLPGQLHLQRCCLLPLLEQLGAQAVAEVGQQVGLELEPLDVAEVTRVCEGGWWKTVSEGVREEIDVSWELLIQLLQSQKSAELSAVPCSSSSSSHRSAATQVADTWLLGVTCHPRVL